MNDSVHPFLRLSETTAPLSAELKEAASRVIDSGWYLHGPETESFERELSAFCGSGQPAIGVSNGLDALRLIFRGYIELGSLKAGDEVLVAANTYIASILPLLEFGLVPKLIEPSPLDFNIDFEKARQGITDKTKGVLLVHLYGNPAWDLDFARYCRDRGILLIEDNAQSIGAETNEEGLNGTKMTGNLADAAAFSFYPTKNLGALGDCGAVITSDRELGDAIKAIANYGSDYRYHNIYRGYNCRMDEIQAAMLRVKLRHLDRETSRRREVAACYEKEIDNPLILKPRIFTDRVQVWHQYPVHTTVRDSFRQYLKSNGIGSDIHYATPPHLQPCMKGLDTPQLPLTESLANTEVSLPIANVSVADAKQISQVINEFCKS